MAHSEVTLCIGWERTVISAKLTPPLCSCRKLPPRLLGELITPEMRLVNTKFELQVDKWKFVGQPRKIPSFKDGEDTRALVFNIVFILEVGSCWWARPWQSCVHAFSLPVWPGVWWR